MIHGWLLITSLKYVSLAEIFFSWFSIWPQGGPVLDPILDSS